MKTVLVTIASTILATSALVAGAGYWIHEDPHAPAEMSFPLRVALGECKQDEPRSPGTALYLCPGNQSFLAVRDYWRAPDSLRTALLDLNGQCHSLGTGAGFEERGCLEGDAETVLTVHDRRSLPLEVQMGLRAAAGQCVNVKKSDDQGVDAVQCGDGTPLLLEVADPANLPELVSAGVKSVLGQCVDLKKSDNPNYWTWKCGSTTVVHVYGAK